MTSALEIDSMAKGLVNIVAVVSVADTVMIGEEAASTLSGDTSEGFKIFSATKLLASASDCKAMNFLALEVNLNP